MTFRFTFGFYLDVTWRLCTCSSHLLKFLKYFVILHFLIFFFSVVNCKDHFQPSGVTKFIWLPQNLKFKIRKNSIKIVNVKCIVILQLPIYVCIFKCTALQKCFACYGENGDYLSPFHYFSLLKTTFVSRNRNVSIMSYK